MKKLRETTATAPAEGQVLTDECRVSIRFSEIDSMRCAWHGSYVRYFEDGRESFGRRYPGIGYADMVREAIYAPVYDLHVKYRAPLTLNDEAIVRTTYMPRRGARLDFSYEVRRASDGQLCAEGSTVQLFIDAQGTFLMDKPQFFEQWQRRYLNELPE